MAPAYTAFPVDLRQRLRKSLKMNFWIEIPRETIQIK